MNSLLSELPRKPVSSRSYFYWLYRVSLSLAAKNIINLILVLTVWWCSCVESSLGLLKKGVCYTRVFSWQNCLSLCPASFCTPRPNLTIILCIFWLLPLAFQSPVMKRTYLFGISSRRHCRSSYNWSISASLAISSWGIDLNYWDVEWFALETNWDHSLVFDIVSKYCISDFFVDYGGIPFLLRDFCPQ